MPLYIDWHEARELPEEIRSTIKDRIKSGDADEFGVVDRGVVYDKTAHRMFCVLDAPDEDAVRRHHEAAGVPVESIHPADAIL